LLTMIMEPIAPMRLDDFWVVKGELVRRPR
jgi:hypothetical protein